MRRAGHIQAYADVLFADYNAMFDAAPEHWQFSLAGVEFEVASDLPEYLEVCRHALPWAPSANTSTPKRILIAGAGNIPGLAGVPIWEDHEYNDARLCRKLEPTGLRVHHYRQRDFWQFHSRDGEVSAQLMATPRSLPEWDIGSPLRNVLHWNMSDSTKGMVHAGTLGVRGKGIMIAGPGGSGKSGTVLAGLLAGLESVGDDYVFASIQSGAVRVQPVFNTLKNDAAGLERLGVKMQGNTNWQGKHQFTFQDLIQRPPDPELAINALCVPVVTGGSETRFEPMPRQRAFLALAETGIKQMPGDQSQNFALSSQIAKHLPTFQLQLSTDPKEIAEVIRQFIKRGEAP